MERADVMMVIGANPTDWHPVFASRMKKRLREDARPIVIDARRIDLVRTAHVEAAYNLPLTPGTDVAVLTAMAHVIVTEGLVDEAFIQERCDQGAFAEWRPLSPVGLDWHYSYPSEIMDEVAALTPTFAGVSYGKLDELGTSRRLAGDAHRGVRERQRTVRAHR